MSDIVTLQIPVGRETHQRIQEIAKSHGVPIRAFGEMIFAQAVRDFDEGCLSIQGPRLERVVKLPKAVSARIEKRKKALKRARPLDSRPCKGR
jgi:hypothetical protein